jgi:hypothetical protein
MSIDGEGSHGDEWEKPPDDLFDALRAPHQREPGDESEYDRPRKPLRMVDFPDGLPPEPKPVAIESLTSAEFFAQEYTDDYLVSNILNRHENCIIGGAMKSLKTSIALDLVMSVGFGCPFLGRFPSQKATVGIISGESGQKTLQGTGKRIAQSKQRLASNSSVHWSFKLPCLIEPRWQRALVKWITERGIELLVVDPTYLALLDMNTARGASNLMVMGAALRELADVLQETGVTPVLIHHVGKSAARTSLASGDPPDLMDLSMSGFGEFARQWLLTGRRERYVAGSGLHKLWLNVGGSAGHSGLYAIDIDEGRKDNPGGRKWDVTIMRGSEAASAAQAEQAEKRASKHAEKQAADLEQAKGRVVTYLQKKPEGETYSRIRDSLGNSKPIREAIAAMQDAGELIECELSRNGRTESAWKLKSSAPGAPGATTETPTGAPVVGVSLPVRRDALRPPTDADRTTPS